MCQTLECTAPLLGVSLAVQGQLADKSCCEGRALWGGLGKVSPLSLGVAFSHDFLHWPPPMLHCNCLVVMPAPGHVAHWPGPPILTHGPTTLGPHQFVLTHQSGPCWTLLSPDLLWSLRIAELHPIGEVRALRGRWSPATPIPVLMYYPTLSLTERKCHRHFVLCCSHRKWTKFSAQSRQSFYRTCLPHKFFKPSVFHSLAFRI